MAELVGLQQQPRALRVVLAVVRDPRLAEDLPAEAARIAASPPLHVNFRNLASGRLIWNACVAVRKPTTGPPRSR